MEQNLTKITDLLKQRDPLLKASNSSNTHGDLDSASVQSGKESSLGRTAKR